MQVNIAFWANFADFADKSADVSKNVLTWRKIQIYFETKKLGS